MARRSSTRKGPKRGGGGQVGLWPYVIAVGAAAIVVAVLILVLSGSGDGDGGDGGNGGDGSVVLPSPRPTEIAQEGHLLGSPAAEVTLIEYADFQ
jgi:hypothetical protein